jgi:mono/diheme cytochrome c family protein
MNLFEYAGKFHPLIVHLPIGILIVFLVLGFFIPRKQLQESYRLIRLILLVSALSATFSCISGLVLSGSGEYDLKLTVNHRNMGIALALFNWIIFIAFKKLLNSPKWIYNTLLVIILLVTILTGHLGGSLTHGSDFLSPPKTNEWFVSTSDYDKKVTINSTAFETVSVIFEENCFSCHGQNKQKGNLRLDTKEGLLTGGDAGSLLADNKSESELLKRIMLPIDDEDHMPPKEKKQLTTVEINFLNWWIKNSADLDKTLAELNLPDSLQVLFAHDEIVSVDKFIPETEVKPADPNVLEKLNSYHVLVSPVAANSNYLSVSFMNVLPANGTNALEELTKLNQQIIRLNLDYQNLDTLAWRKVGFLTNLRKLSLKNSNMDDEKLVHLKSLNSLVSLNLTATNVTSTGLENSLNLPELESIYLYQTNIDEAGFKSLNSKFPSVKIVTGNYFVPVLESDTTVFKL